MKLTKKLLCAAVASGLMAASAHAQYQNTGAYNKPQTGGVRPTYNYAGLKYVVQKLDEYDCSQDGLNLEGSFAFTSQFFARGTFGDVSDSEGKCGSSSISFAGGYRAAWGSSSHLYGLVGFTSYTPDNGDGDSGLLLAGGLRGYVSPGVEAFGQVQYTSTGDGELGVAFGGAYWFNANFAITGDIGLGDGQSSFAVGGRLTW